MPKAISVLKKITETFSGVKDMNAERNLSSFHVLGALDGNRFDLESALKYATPPPMGSRRHLSDKEIP